MNPIRALLATTVALATLALALALATAQARAGTWMQVSCVNPDGSTAPPDGWSNASVGSPGGYSYAHTSCGAGTPMTAVLSSKAPAAASSNELLRYQPPSGSRLIGGTVNVNMAADGTGYGAFAASALFEPAFSTDDDVFGCAAEFGACSPGTSHPYDYVGDVSLPSQRGGDFTAAVGCVGSSGDSCDTSASQGAWALVQIVWAHFLLSSAVAPQGSDFSGSALQRNAQGTAHLVFTATDPGGPGVYSVSAAIDGRTVWSGVPSTNSGACVPVGTDPSSGAMMFDAQQPCLQTEVADVPVPTAGLPDGPHELAVTVTDAAQNSSPVLDQTITTSNPQTTPVPRSGRAVHARFVISWSWSGNHTTLRSIKVQKLTSHAKVAVRCLGRGCPRLRVRSATAHRVGKLLRNLDGKRFRAGDKLHITVTARGRTPERIELQMRGNRLPQARLLKR
jgi:hypothetical protein